MFKDDTFVKLIGNLELTTVSSISCEWRWATNYIKNNNYISLNSGGISMGQRAFAPTSYPGPYLRSRPGRSCVCSWPHDFHQPKKYECIVSKKIIKFFYFTNKL